MSIEDEIAARIAEGRLRYLEPEIEGDEICRYVYVIEELWRELNGRHDDPAMRKRFAELRAFLDAFITGKRISIGADSYRKHNSAYLSRLDPARDEVWEFRNLKPKPSIRVFGSFAMPDHFVATSWALRKDLKGRGSREWRDAKVNSRAMWRQLFPAHDPFTRASLNDYAQKTFLV